MLTERLGPAKIKVSLKPERIIFLLHDTSRLHENYLNCLKTGRVMTKRAKRFKFANVIREKNLLTIMK